MGRAWTFDQDQLLNELQNRGLSSAEIAQHMDRTLPSIKARRAEIKGAGRSHRRSLEAAAKAYSLDLSLIAPTPCEVHLASIARVYGAWGFPVLIAPATYRVAA